METIEFKQPQPTSIPNLSKYVIPPSDGQGGVNEITFSSGLHLSTLDCRFKKNTLFEACYDERTVGFSFCLEGRVDLFKSKKAQPISVSTGDNSFYSFSKSSEYIEKVGDKRMKIVNLVLGGETLARLATGDEDYFSPVLKSLDSNSAILQGRTTPAMKSILHEILYCPYRGMAGQIFLEGKAMELFALKLGQIDSRISGNHSAMKSANTEQIYYAAELLVSDLVNPPNLSEITEKIGMSRSTFYRYFKIVFGHTPLDHLRCHRLQAAMQLLQQGEHNVSEAAFAVGFNNLSYFSRAFVAHFGTPPHRFF